MDINKTYTGHNIDVMSTFPDKCIDCIITSPPYYQLRNYKTEHQIWGGVDNCPHEFESYEITIHSGSTKSEIANGQNQVTNLKSTSAFCKKCNAWKGELGLEPTFQLYIDHLIMVFSECKRVLKDEGTLWVNLGDSYSGSGNDSRKKEGSISQQITKQKVGIANPMHAQPKQSLQSKCLLNIPSRFRIAMTDQLGFIQRNNIIWYKNNCMPSSATDRFTVDFEDIMFFTKKKNYYFEQQFEKSVDPESYSGRRSRKLPLQAIEDPKNFAKMGSYDENGNDRDAGKKYPNRNMRTVWNVNTSGSKDKHYAMYPEKLLVRMIEAGCPKEICNKCGKARKKINKPILNDELEGDTVNYKDTNYAIQERTGLIESRNLPPLQTLKEFLNKWKGQFTIKEIEALLDSQAPHHWFSGESYPSAEDWIKLKEILCFSDKFDKQMTEIKYKPAEKCKTEYKSELYSCNCNAGFHAGIVLDPFGGSGTTGITAKKLQRNFINIELNPEYSEMAINKYHNTIGDLF